jgi:hypothetical protein
MDKREKDPLGSGRADAPDASHVLYVCMQSTYCIVHATNPRIWDPGPATPKTHPPKETLALEREQQLFSNCCTTPGCSPRTPRNANQNMTSKFLAFPSAPDRSLRTDTTTHTHTAPVRGWVLAWLLKYLHK